MRDITVWIATMLYYIKYFVDWFIGRHNGATGAGIALVLLFLMLSTSCKTIPIVDTHTSSVNDSIVTELYSIIEEQKVAYDELYAKYEQVTNNITSENTTEQSEITVIERYDTSGVLVERVRNEKLTSSVEKQQQTIERLTEESNSLNIQIDELRQENDSLRTELSKHENEDTNTVVEKEVVPTWCWFCLVFSILALAIWIARLFRLI